MAGILIFGPAIGMGALDTARQNVYPTQNIEAVENIIIRSYTDDIKILYENTDRRY